MNLDIVTLCGDLVLKMNNKFDNMTNDEHQTAIIDKNTAKIRDWLFAQGYRISEYTGYSEDESLCICTSFSEFFGPRFSLVDKTVAHHPSPNVTWECAGRICCGTDEEKFFKIAEIRH